jgi:hypothetical protein
MIHEVFAATPEELERALTWRDIRPPQPVAPTRKKKSWFSRSEEEPEPISPVSAEHPLEAIEIGSMDDICLATLEALLYGEPLDDIDSIVGLVQDPILVDPPESPEAYISPMSPRLVAAMQTVDRSRLDSIVDEWVATEEMAMWERGPALEVLQEISDFVRQARADDRSLYRIFRL